MIKIVVAYNKKYNTVNVYIHGLEKIFEVLRKYNFEQGDENDVLWWFGYPEDVDLAKLIDDLRRVATNVEYVEEQ